MSRSFGSRWFTTRPPIRISPPLISSRPGDHAQHARLAAAGRPDEHDELAVADLEVERLDRARSVRVGLLEPREADLSHRRAPACTLPRAPARLRRARANACSKSAQREAVGDELSGPEAACVQQRDDTRPGGGRVAEAGDDREVVVDEHVGRQRQGRAGRRQPEEQCGAAAAQRADRRFRGRPSPRPPRSRGRSRLAVGRS